MPSGTSFAEAVGLAVGGGHGGGRIAFGALEVALAGSLRHGADRSHAAIRLERAALVQNQFAGAFVGAGEERSDHDGARARGQSLGDVAGILDAAIGDDRNARIFGGAVGFGDRRDLRNAGAGDDARGADGAGPDADLDAVGAGASQFAGAVEGGDVAGEQFHVRAAFDLTSFTASRTLRGVPVRAVDGEHVDFGLGQFLRALQKISGGADGRAYAQAALRIFRGVGILQFLLDVFDRDQALEVVLVVDDQKFFDAMFVKNFFGFFERGSHGNRDEIFLGHHLVDGNVEAGFEAQIAIGENADQLSVLGDGHAGDLVLAHDLERIADLVGGEHGDRIDDHAAFRALHLVDFVGLLLDASDCDG